jgi:hypothetical protein
MYGLVNAAVEDFVCTNFGRDQWETIKARAGVTSQSFNRMESYPDELTYKLVEAACGVLGVTAEQALRGFGGHWVLYTGREGYGNLFDMAGRSLKEFLLNLDNLHTRVGQSFAKLKPPSFRFDILDDETLRMHYHPGGGRTGLCPMVDGLLEGLSKHFKQALTMEHDVCKVRGADHCEWLLTVSPHE